MHKSNSATDTMRTLLLALALGVVLALAPTAGARPPWPPSVAAAPSSSSSSYVEAEAWYAMLFSAAAYCPRASVESWTCTACRNSTLASFELLGVVEYNETKTFGLVGIDPPRDRCILAFRGTMPSDLTNWITDLHISKHTTYPGITDGLVHAGFFDAYNRVRNDTHALLAQALERVPKCTLYLTGHSLGAALASMAALDVKLHLPEFVDPVLLDFGSPRVANSVVASFIHDSYGPHTFRVTHYRDIVPHLPPQELGFQHYPREVWYNEVSDHYRVCDGTGEDPLCADSIKFLESIPDHLHYLGYPISRSC
eukprot:m.236015 g.236015  ORF g.236015 m.236015 type:complete len:311 (+) comp10893_c0_seq8:1162-2094(+)